jgi:endonuclease YncB( thermonuclease family)
MNCFSCFSFNFNFNLKSSKNLLKITKDDLDYFSFNGLKMKVKIVDVYDGDTFTGCFYFKNEIIKYKFRCFGYNSPEIKPLKSLENRDIEIKNALIAKHKFIEYIEFYKGDLIEVEFNKFDKYGRILAILYDKNGNNINQKMIDNNFGKIYII